MADPLSTASRVATTSAVRRAAWLAAACAVAVSLLGLALRVEHALTFDGPKRGADYAVNVKGVYWMSTHWRPFDFTPEVSTQVGYQPPLWFALGAIILKITGQERPIAWLAVIGWCVRQWLLWLLLRRAIPKHPWSRLAALAVHAVLPISVLTDGKLNPEGLHTTLFMVAVYGLFCLEQELRAQRFPQTCGQSVEASAYGATLHSAILLGTFSGLAVMTKATGGILPGIAGIVFAWQYYCMRSAHEPRDHLRGLWRAAAVAAVCWCIVAGWWCGPNLIKYHHPFPHIWNLRVRIHAPIWLRRSRDWILPFEWASYLRFPVIYTPQEPTPNFWATSVVGTWTDIYNRGFCRLQGGGTTDRVFGANWGPDYGAAWWVTWRCIHLFSKLAWVGLVLSIESTAAVIYVLWTHLRSRGEKGSLALPVAIGLVTFFVLLFALVYPFDSSVVLNPRYLLPAAAPMSACLGIALANMPVAPKLKVALHALTLSLIGIVGALVVYERWGS
ncbi:MAG: hypothetical protein RL701_6459 [Pseudomonadota bacterium]